MIMCMEEILLWTAAAAPADDDSNDCLCCSHRLAAPAAMSYTDTYLKTIRGPGRSTILKQLYAFILSPAYTFTYILSLPMPKGIGAAWGPLFI